MVYWLSSWLAEREVRGSIPSLAATISEIGYLLLPNRNMADTLYIAKATHILKTTNQLTKQYRCGNSFTSIEQPVLARVTT